VVFIIHRQKTWSCEVQVANLIRCEILADPDTYVSVKFSAGWSVEQYRIHTGDALNALRDKEFP